MSDSAERSAVVLLSGGLDSATVLAIAQAQRYACHALSFDYGQRHQVELAAAQRIAEASDVVEHRVIRIDLRAFGHSALTDRIDVPKDREAAEMGDDIPVTYVPARNTIFLSYALAMAEVIGSSDIFIGVNAVDYSGYPDCRPQYIEAFQRMGRLATRAGIEGAPLTLHTPLIQLSKVEIIRRGLSLGVDYSLTHSCYDPDEQGRPCRHCDACLLRMRAFGELGMTDPLIATN
jgi:7-cyano-7-deazaguanine synthase